MNILGKVGKLVRFGGKKESHRELDERIQAKEEKLKDLEQQQVRLKRLTEMVVVKRGGGGDP